MFWAAILTWREDRRREAEFERVMGEHGAALARVSVAYAPAGSLREDLEQEIALGVWEALPRWNETASLKTFLFRVAHNRCIDVMRKQRPETSLDAARRRDGEVAFATSPSRRLAARQLLTQIEALVLELPLAQRQAFTLSLEGLTYEEIAEVMGVTSNHVGVLVYRTRAAVREAFGEERS